MKLSFLFLLTLFVNAGWAGTKAAKPQLGLQNIQNIQKECSKFEKMLQGAQAELKVDDKRVLKTTVAIPEMLRKIEQAPRWGSQSKSAYDTFIALTRPNLEDMLKFQSFQVSGCAPLETRAWNLVFATYALQGNAPFQPDILKAIKVWNSESKDRLFDGLFETSRLAVLISASRANIFNRNPKASQQLAEFEAQLKLFSAERKTKFSEMEEMSRSSSQESDKSAVDSDINLLARKAQELAALEVAGWPKIDAKINEWLEKQ